MNTETLKMFILISQKGSISAAADDLGYAQSNISTKVHQLETTLNTQLFYRTNHGITLTDSGKDFYKQAVRIVALTDEAINNLQNPHETQGKLHLGTLQTAASTFLPKVLANYHQENPNVELSIVTGTTMASATRVLNYELDGAIIGGTVSEKNLVSIPLKQEELCLITATTDKVDINNSSLLVFPVGCAYRKMLENWLDSQKIMIHHPIEFNYLNAIIASVSAGLGISVLPKQVALPFVQSKSIKMLELPARFATLPISFIYRKDYIVSRSFHKFIEIIKK